MVDKEETNIGAHALLITPEGEIILQQREDKPGIVNPGLVSMFGGTIKRNDTVMGGLRRELMEELELDVSHKEVRELGKFFKTKETDGVDWEVNVFVVLNVLLSELKLHEGKEIFCASKDEILKSDKLTRMTRLAVEKYI